LKLQIPDAQRFTCAQCGACCRGGWVVVTPSEVEGYRARGVARFANDPERPDADPFEPAAHGHFRLRRRADGACVFLTDAGRCRIHEELGAQAKPLACRAFPFVFHPAAGRPLVTAATACPTVARNAGEPLPAQARALAALGAEWARAFPERDRPLELAHGREIAPATVGVIRDSLLAMLDREPGDLARGVARWHAWLADLSRHRVQKLPREALGEYVALTGRHHATSAPAPPHGMAPAVTRLLFRGFLFAAMATRDRARPDPPSFARHLRHLAHLHGLAPATGAVDRRALEIPLDLADPEVARLLRHAVTAIAQGVGTGRRPVLDEIAVGAATLAAACALAAMEARRDHADRVDATRLVSGLTGAGTLGHGDTGALASLLTTLAGGVDALLLAEARLRPQRAGVAAER
jgi:Fe-S-cluster containining protein